MLVLLACLFYGVAYFVHVALEASLEKRTFIGKVLVECAHGYSGAGGDAGCGQALLADGEKNLNGGL
jgi:hypothetical protein